MSDKIVSWLFKNKTLLLFAVLSLGAFYYSGQSINFVTGQLVSRVTRNTFLVLSLLIPIQAGMGLNFGMVIGAIAAQIALFIVSYFEIGGIGGFLLCVLISLPISMLFGYLMGNLFNRMKGSEMIGGMILKFFSDGLYQLLFLFIIGGIIPLSNHKLLISGGVGVTNTIDLTGGLKYALDDLVRMQLLDVFLLATLAVVLYVLILILRITIKSAKKHDEKFIDSKVRIMLSVVGICTVLYGCTYIPAVEALITNSGVSLTVLDAMLFIIIALALCVVVFVAYQIIIIARNHKEDFKSSKLFKQLITAGICIVFYSLTYIPMIEGWFKNISVPMITVACIAALCMFNNSFIKTVLGQKMRTVGQSMSVAKASGINVDRIRITAMIMSTVLAGWGQLIYLQNLGTFSTYGAHMQIGEYAIAALLVGGASIYSATNKQAIIGVILFHTLFLVSPDAGNNLFNSAQIGEYFRVFICYGVIAVSLALHAWKGRKKRVTV